MEMLETITECESLKNVSQNVYDELLFNKIASLFCTNCSSTIFRIYHRYLLAFPKWFLQDRSL